MDPIQWMQSPRDQKWSGQTLIHYQTYQEQRNLSEVVLNQQDSRANPVVTAPDMLDADQAKM